VTNTVQAAGITVTITVMWTVTNTATVTEMITVTPAGG
jgi:hypothetical protein